MSRPPKPKADRNVTPARQAGRVADDEWQLIIDAAAVLGVTKTAFLIEPALRRARRVLSNKRKQ